jgi:hypothetical protein
VPRSVGVFDKSLYHRLIEKINKKPEARSMIVTPKLLKKDAVVAELYRRMRK